VTIGDHGMVASAQATRHRTITDELRHVFGEHTLSIQSVQDEIPTLWIARERTHDLLRYLRCETDRPYCMLYDLTAIDERVRSHREGLPASDFTVVYHLLSFDRNEDIRIKVPLREENLLMPSITDLWPAANWYEREAWDMFGIVFDGHPHLTRILMPPWWEGHPLRKDHPSRATEMGPFTLPPEEY
jgi:NADH-quinone oxidoreductase subunit C/D